MSKTGLKNRNPHNIIDCGENYFKTLGKAVGISHAKRLTGKKKHNICSLVFCAHFSMHVNEMFNPSLDCFIRTGSTDQRGPHRFSSI